MDNRFKELKDSEFNMFREIVYRESGINLTDRKKALMQSRLMRRLRETSMRDYNEYYDFLNDNYDSEIVNFINCITTNKTDFFREPKQFEYLEEVILPDMRAAGKEEIRIWSAGCSTGEEPYTIAVTLLDFFRDRQVDIKILATDIDTAVLESAREGIYPEESLARVDPGMIRSYFDIGRGDKKGLYRVKNFVKDRIYFRRLNLQLEAYPMKRKFDIIFCRNVIIYFDKPTQYRLFERFHRHLGDDGHLFLGHSETTGGRSDLFSFRKNSIYRKVSHVYQG